jgi:hypothetical protein
MFSLFAMANLGFFPTGFSWADSLVHAFCWTSSITREPWATWFRMCRASS